VSPSSLSARGARAAATPLRIDHAAFREAMADRFHPSRNPSGALPLNIAENRLSWPLLRSRLEEAMAAGGVPDWVPTYASHRGAAPFRVAAASFLSEHLTRCPVDPDSLGVSAGATSVIEMTAHLLADAGDVAVIPAPCYPVYRQDIGNMAGVERYDLVTHHELSEIARGPALRIEHLERAKRDIEASGRRFRMLVLTTPDNPTGGVYPTQLLQDIADWCVARGTHLLVNELYGLSLIDTSHPAIRQDYHEDVPFVSVARLMADRQSDYLHLCYAVSKDLGISGFRVGMLHSHNRALLQAYENLNLTHSASNLTQWVLLGVLTDSAFMGAYVKENQMRLTESYALVVEALRALGVPYVPSRGSLFAWIDLSELLDEDSEAGELALWMDLYRSARVLLTPGVGFGHTKRGCFRVVYPSVTRDELAVATTRLSAWVEERRKPTA
jgi:aspartate/methionine/tyrosine aminotransferase